MITYATAFTRSTAFQDWALANGLPPDPLALGANGLANLQNFAFGINPGAPGGGPLIFNGTFGAGGSIAANGTPITMIESSPSGTDMRALFIRRKDAGALGITCIPEFSTALSAWSASIATPAVLADDGTYQIVSVPFPVLQSWETSCFFHVKITSP